ncbi:MAG: hypothetical protein V3U43_05870 [Pseudomonadales bacterium]
MKSSRIHYPRGTWMTIVLLIVVFGAFGLWVGANADIGQGFELTSIASPFDPLLHGFVKGR